MFVTTVLFLALLIPQWLFNKPMFIAAKASAELVDEKESEYYYNSKSNDGDSSYYYTYLGGANDDLMKTEGVEVESTTSTYTQYLGSYARTWLELHNQRRKKYTEMYGYEYVPLMWSRVIARSAQKYANVLAMGQCSDLRHDPTNPWGENLAMISGTDSPERVMSMWVEGEQLEPNAILTGRNLHMTQVLWRASHYVGCGTATTSECHLYVCRYITPGNCNIGTTTWLSDMMQPSSPCLPHCPPGEGCFSPADL